MYGLLRTGQWQWFHINLQVLPHIILYQSDSNYLVSRSCKEFWNFVFWIILSLKTKNFFQKSSKKICGDPSFRWYDSTNWCWITRTMHVACRIGQHAWLYRCHHWIWRCHHLLLPAVAPSGFLRGVLHMKDPLCSQASLKNSQIWRANSRKIGEKTR